VSRPKHDGPGSRADLNGDRGLLPETTLLPNRDAYWIPMRMGLLCAHMPV
jgi:hypothetical protein